MIYLDNSATSYPKPLCVKRAVRKSIGECGGNAGRSGHFLSLKTAENIYNARETVANHIGFNCPERIVFTVNATHALNLAIKGLITEPCHVIISNLEHNSVLRPIISLQDKIGVKYSVFDARKPLYEEIASHVRPDTKYIICTAVSNVTGADVDIRILSEVAKEYGIGLILDLSQYLGHRRLDVSGMHFSALCAPGHKGLLGVMGCGFAVFGKDINPTPIFEGGSGYDTLNRRMPDHLPERMEAGTLPTTAIVSLMHGIRYIENHGVICIEKKLSSLCSYAHDNLAELGFTTVYGAENGIVAFNVNDISSIEVASFLDKNGIYVRGGLQCAPLAHAAYNTLNQGMVRASFSLYNSRGDVDKLIRALYREYKNSRR